MQNATVLVVGDLWVGIKSTGHRDLLTTLGGYHNILANLKLTALSINREFLFASEAVRVCVLALFELKREDSHADQVASVDSLVALSNHSLDTLEVRTLCGPVTR